MSYLYIVGDSYCSSRTDIKQHWPAILSSQLNLELQGTGFAGQGWWPVRQHFLNYISSDKFEQTKYFIFCHTQPERLLSSNPIFEGTSMEADYAKKIWHTYIQTYDVSNWCMQQWFQELNKLLHGKKVLHLKCFELEQQYFSILNGIKFTTPLLDLAVESVGEKPWTWGNSDKAKQLMNQYHNHLSPDYNVILADRIYKKLITELTD